MKLHYITLAAASLLGTAVAQSLSDLPSCASKCATNSLPKSCSQLDIGCFCSDKSFISDMSCCVAKSCSKDGQETALKFARQICSTAGVNDLPNSASCDSGASETATTTTAGSSTETTASASGVSGSTTSATTSTAASSSESSSSSAASGTPTNAAAAVGQNKEAVLAAAAGAAAVALLA